MTEETLFAAALEKGTLTERAAFLDEACSGDVTVRSAWKRCSGRTNMRNSSKRLP